MLMVTTNPYESPFPAESTSGLAFIDEPQDASSTTRRDSTRVIPAGVCLILGCSLVGMSFLWICTTWNTTFGSNQDFLSRLITPVVAVGMASGGGLLLLAFRRWLRGWWRSAILTSLLGCLLGYAAFRIAINLLT